jgi:hypothetical protein
MWFGLSIMLAMIVGLVWWFIWAMRRDKNQEAERERSSSAVPSDERKVG